MTAEEGINRLNAGCVKDREGRFFFSCKEAVVVLKVRGVHHPLHFPAQDRVAFRIADNGLKVERLDTGVAEKFFRWAEIESLVAGEPETTSGTLFQG